MMIHFFKVVSNYQILSPFLTIKQHNKASYNQAKVDGHTFKFQATAEVSQDPEHKYWESGEKQHVSTLWVCPEIVNNNYY